MIDRTMPSNIKKRKVVFIDQITINSINSEAKEKGLSFSKILRRRLNLVECIKLEVLKDGRNNK